ncbi:NACHT domain- and WD repeat-containing protein 1-like [Nerophis ophidion]|uniref:NACHT domain- and WD repeat-containing protein 1-like n=1 Tax=Nerophis ophidion TaxID=159077 RepID=UPI002ADF1ACF|nr:NACHT domain- and WD repeat-containing protein 1-like [Nerophis ophidion]XP_061744694.1 NACHT domain- and WD repeat-containing protein 1-like [Nerophis ophidion]XP_061744695.1 NACHT domain- and WD repeat-containing protein 1-like [Nerophis ophidion]
MAASVAADRDVQDILRGHWTPTMKTSNMIRVFISSAFTDMSGERRALLEKAYPQVLAFCRSMGLAFEVVDLGWGIGKVTSGEHDICELSLREISISKKKSAGPAFVALLGNRYGQRPLPAGILHKQFELLVSKLANKPDAVSLLTNWYMRDDNAVPPTYFLQPVTTHFLQYSDLQPERAARCDEEGASWRVIEARLLQHLRFAAGEAEAAGDITAKERSVFFTSVTEQELEHGLEKDADGTSALLFIREVPRLAKGGPRRLARFMDATGDGLLDVEAQGLLAGLKSRLYASCKDMVNVHWVELSRGAIEPRRKEHAQYLDAISQQFVCQMKARVTAALQVVKGGGPRKVWGSTEDTKHGRLAEEVSRHLALSGQLCRGLHGREGLLAKLCLAMWEATNVRHGPLVVHGAAGMGKTALLCKLAQEMRSVMEARATLVVRLLGARHLQREDIDRLLLSVCLQICLACALAPPTSLSTHQEIVSFFQEVLLSVSQQGGVLLVVLDGVDQLCERHGALCWLPRELPPNVHLVISMDTNSEAFVAARFKLNSVEPFFQVDRLTREDGRRVMESQLSACQRTLTPEQAGAALQCFHSTGCPVHLRLIVSAAKRWTSSTPLTRLCLGANAQEMMAELFLMLEEKHGREMVGGALGYIALAREGLLEAELRDIMSLDNDVISEVYKFSLPQTPALIRFPPMLWSRLQRDLEDHLEERWTCGVAAIAFRERRLLEAVSARYLTMERRGRSLTIMAEYFQGVWCGKLKPVALPGLTLLVADRKVPPQPLWFTPQLANVRKLQELPYHLLHAGLWEELRRDVIGSAEWLFCKSAVMGVSSVIQDLDQCSLYMDCTETRLLRDALVLMEPGLDFLGGHVGASHLYTELLARLRHLATPFPSLIGRLCSQCEECLLTSSEPVLIPKCSFLPPPGGALQHTLAGLRGGVVCVDLSVEAELLVAGSDEGAVAVWSLADGHLERTLSAHTAAILSLKLIQSPAHCLSLGADGSLKRWSLTSGQQLLCVQEAWPVDHTPSPVHLHLCGQLIFAYNRTHVSMLTSDGVPTLPLAAHEGSLCLGILEDSVMVLSQSGQVRILGPGGGASGVAIQLEEWGRTLTAVNSVTLPERGQVFLLSSQGFLYQISRSGKHSRVHFPLRPSLFSVTADEKILLAGSDVTLSLFNIHIDSIHSFLQLKHDADVLCARVSSDARLIATGAVDQLIRVWSLTTGALLDVFCGSEAPITRVLFYERFLVSTCAAASCLHVWAVNHHKPPAHIPAGSAHVAVTKDAEQVFYVSGHRPSQVVSWNNNTGKASGHLALSAAVSCLALAQHKRLLLVGLSSGAVLIYPLDLPEETLAIPPPESLRGVLQVALSVQETRAVVAYEDSLCVFHITTRERYPSLEGPLERVQLSAQDGTLSAVALLSDRRLLYGTECGGVTLYDGARGGATTTLERHRSNITCLTPSNWGTHFLVGSQDAVQQLWSLKPLAVKHVMEYKGVSSEGVACAAFSESDQVVFTGSRDKTIKVWDVTSGNLLLVQSVESAVVAMVTFRNGFVALAQRGVVIQEVFRSPQCVAPDYNPLRTVKARYRVTSTHQGGAGQRGGVSHPQDFNPAHFTLDCKAPPSPTCVLL